MRRRLRRTRHQPSGRAAATSVPPILYLLAAGVSLLGLLLGSRRPLQRPLAIEGVAAHGCITECSDPSRSGFVLTYTFRSVDNDEVQIGSCRSDLARKVGSSVRVLYLPADRAEARYILLTSISSESINHEGGSVAANHSAVSGVIRFSREQVKAADLCSNVAQRSCPTLNRC